MAFRSPKGQAIVYNLFKVSKFNDKFDIVVKFDPAGFDEKDKVAWSQLLTEVDRAAKEEHGDDYKKIRNFKYPFFRGQEKTDPDEKNHFDDPNCVYVKLSTQYMPAVVGPNPDVILEKKDFRGRPTVIVSYDANGYDVDVSKGVNLYLGNVQLIKAAAGGVKKTDPTEDFETYEEVADDLFNDAAY